MLVWLLRSTPANATTNANITAASTTNMATHTTAKTATNSNSIGSKLLLLILHLRIPTLYIIDINTICYYQYCHFYY